MKSGINILWNPFKTIAGFKAFAIGIVIVTATVILGYYSQTAFIGNLQVKIVNSASFTDLLTVQAISLALTVALMYISAVILSRNVRFVDILGTATLARYPFILAALPAFFVARPDIEALRESVFANTFTFADIGGILIAGIIMMAVAIFATVILYRAYRTSSGLKGPKLYWSFIIAAVASEVISGVIGFRILY